MFCIKNKSAKIKRTRPLYFNHINVAVFNLLLLNNITLFSAKKKLTTSEHVVHFITIYIFTGYHIQKSVRAHK